MVTIYIAAPTFSRLPYNIVIYITNFNTIKYAFPESEQLLAAATGRGRNGRRKRERKRKKKRLRQLNLEVAGDAHEVGKGGERKLRSKEQERKWREA